MSSAFFTTVPAIISSLTSSKSSFNKLTNVIFFTTALTEEVTVFARNESSLSGNFKVHFRVYKSLPKQHTPIQFNPVKAPHPIYLRPVLILLSQLSPRLPIGHFSTDFPTKLTISVSYPHTCCSPILRPPVVPQATKKFWITSLCNFPILLQTRPLNQSWKFFLNLIITFSSQVLRFRLFFCHKLCWDTAVTNIRKKQ